MMSLRRKLSLLLFSCATIIVILITLFVNQTIQYQVDQYMLENQVKRNARLVTYFEDLYEKNEGYNKESGIELMHEAYMNQYCLILMDADKNIIWGMNPDSLSSMERADGVYQAQIYELTVNHEVVGYLEIGQHGSLLLSQADVALKDSINQSIAFSTGIVLIILVGLSLLLSKPLSTQMAQVAQMSRQLSKGNFDWRMKSHPNIQEIQMIEEGMNSLALQLQTQQTLRKQLVSDVSHELRTPLNILQTNLEGMMDGIISVTPERLQSLNQEVIRFGKLLSNLEVLKQVDATQLAIDLKPMSLSHLLETMESDLQALCLSNGIVFEMDKLTKEEDDILGDEQLLKQVILNLMSNACKFTAPGGVIQVQVLAEKHQICLKVVDTGIGIEASDLPYVFERFYRADRSRNQTEGSGIGLSIVAEIVKLHGANVTILSQYGEGTTVEVSFSR